MKLRYRPEIDGLRAIAVISVVLYHAEFIVNGIDILKGGFIGVDVFFVISGYLIAGILLREIDKRGSINYLNFYERRARRILPALFTVMMTSIPFAWLYMYPKAMKEYAGSVLSSLAFSSNFWFWQEDSYIAEPSALKPFLHTWSLSVEEQFYIFFPIILLIAWRYARNHITILLLILFFCSLQWAQFSSDKYSEAAFFLLPMRGWEILGGVLLAKYEFDKGRINHPILNSIMPILGLVLILYAFLFFEDGMRHPSYLTLIPVLGSVFLIMFAKKGGLVTAILSNKIVVGIGLISYSFYLWHFPILVFARIKGESILNNQEKLECIIISLLLSIFTYFFIEQPARKSKQLNLSTFLGLTFLSFSVIVLCLGYFYKTEGAKFRFKEFNQLVELNYWDESKGNRDAFFTYPECWTGDYNSNPDNPFKICRSHEKQTSGKKIMVIGDSHIAGLIPGLIKHIGREMIVERIIDSCLPLPNYKSHTVCENGRSQAFSEIKELNPDLIIIGGCWVDGQEVGQLENLFKEELLPYKDKTILMGPLPRWGEKGLPRLLEERYSEKQEIPEKLAPLENTFYLDDVFSRFSKKIGIGYISPVRTFCDAGQCMTKVNEFPEAVTSWDYAHLTEDASIYLVKRNLELIKNKAKMND